MKKQEENGNTEAEKDKLETLEERLEKLRKREKELTEKEEQELQKQKEILNEIQTMKVAITEERKKIESIQDQIANDEVPTHDSAYSSRQTTASPTPIPQPSPRQVLTILSKKSYKGPKIHYQLKINNFCPVGLRFEQYNIPNG